tara:strand:- start:66 stop:833 length:768 start_codon:yes stop_codon:yes gene_type:complete
MMQQMLLGYTTPPASGGPTYLTNNLVLNLDAGDSSTYSGSILQDQVGSGDCTFSGGGYSYTSDYGGGIRLGNSNFGDSNWDGGSFTTPNIESVSHTWELWTNMTHSSTNSGGYTYIVHNNNISTNTGSSFVTIGVNSANNYFAAMGGTYSSMDSGVSGVYYNSNGNSSNYHIVLVWEQGWERMYINGVNVVQHNMGTSSIPNFNSTTSIAANSYDSGIDYREAMGTFYSLRIYSQALSASDVLANFNGNKGKFGL